MNVSRMGHTATLLPDGRVFVAGGLFQISAGVSAIRDAVDTAEVYDPVADTWTPTPTNMTVPRAAHAAVLRPDGRVQIIGGLSWFPVIIFGWLPTVEASCDVYDPVANTITPGTTMVSARSFVEPLALGNDRYLLAGGIATVSLAAPGTPTTAAEIYDAAADNWTAVGAMANARAFHKGWELDNGDFMLAGGAAGDILNPIPSSGTEVFSTASNTFSAGPSLTVPRTAPAIFLTPQGQVHVMGGGSTNNTIVNTTEFYYR